MRADRRAAPAMKEASPMQLSHGTRDEVMASARRTILVEAEGVQALHAALDGALGDRLVEAVASIDGCGGRVIVTGMGKSGHVARKIASTLASTGTPAYFVHPAEASHGDLGMIHGSDVVLALSWSGEAPELADIVAYTRRFGVTLVAITSRAGSALGSAADVPLVLPAMPEACPNGLAPTTSTTMQMAMGDVLAVALLSLRGFSASDFRQFHPGGKLGAQLRRARDLMHAGGGLPVVPADAMLSQAIVEMTGKRLGVTAVVDAEGRLAGVITDGDVRSAMEGGFVDRPVASMMTRNPRCIEPEMLVQEALAMMQKARITSLFVVEDTQLLGVLHIHDLLREGVV
jgi:arabinose-5-phosphate isomerase